MSESKQNSYSPAQLSKLQNAITTWQSKLLDLSRGNRLLRFRETKVSTVQITHPDTATIFDWLVLGDRKVPVVSLTPDDVPGQATLLNQNVSETTGAAMPVNALASPMNADKLSSALYNLRQRAYASIEERGVNVLYIALGFVVWNDPQDAKQELRAPLLLLPVTIEKSATNKYVVNALDEDVVLNPTLVYKLEHEYQVTLPEFPDELDEFKLDEYLAQVSQSLARLRGATIQPNVFLGLFSFLKIPMYQDLIRQEDTLLDHPLVARLAGLLPVEKDSTVGRLPNELDRIIDPRSTFQVLDADSSQQEALFAARQGTHLLIQGPPGTGKSQTITNLIGECLAEGKKVLFVSEKAAALEVVKRNLDACGIGEACLELHSHRADKKKILTDLQRILEAPVPAAPLDAPAKLQAVVHVRDELNTYVRSLHQPRFALDKSVFQVYGLFDQVRTAPQVDFPLSDMVQITEADVQNRYARLEVLTSHVAVINDLNAHPWYGLKKRTPSIAFTNEIRIHLESLKQAVQELDRIINGLTQLTGLTWPHQIAQIRELVQFFSKYRIDMLRLSVADWRIRFEQKYATMWRYVYPDYWQNLDQLKAFCRAGWTTTLAVIQSDLVQLEKIKRILGTAGSLPADQLVWQPLTEILPLLDQIREESEYVRGLFEPAILDPLEFESETDRIRTLSERYLQNLERLDDFLFYLNDRDQAIGAGLGDFITAALRRAVFVQDWPSAYLRAFYTAWLAEAGRQARELAFFSRAEHEKRIEQFRILDREQIRLARQTIVAKIAAGRPHASELIQRAPSAEINILLREFKKRRRVKPLRKLFRETPQVIQALKPCFMMSPLSVSQYLDSTGFRFDVVVFDEASQVRVEDAIGCIVRGKQVVVAGDSKQLPPTRFFDVMTSESDWDEDTEDDSDAYESILDMLGTIPDLVLNKMLRWHYRSRYEELIAFSNKNFYDNRLYTFPHPEQAGARKAVEFVYVPKGIYERGGTRKNLIEAQRVVELVLKHVQDHPGWSLAVVTFSDAQRDAVQRELDRQLEQHPEIKTFFEDNGKEEPFRIKNLELIQGDERDVIIFSVGYGRDEAGNPPSLNFGPLNKAGGQRRLNVAVTRARQHVVVVSSIQPEELSRSENAGVRLLREYMLLARDGLKALLGNVAFGDAGETESPFEAAVYARLIAAGQQVHRQVGCSGYRIDLAIVDPKIPGRYCLAVECDGATYHSARTARDRDRLRQQVLETLGWRVHRIWSRDWVANPERETQRVLGLVQVYAGTPPQIVEPVPIPPAKKELNVENSTLQNSVLTTADPIPVADWEPNGKDVVYYDSFRGRLRSVMDSVSLIADDIVSIIKAQGPSHRDALFAPLAEAWGYQRPGKRVRESMSQGLAYAASRRMVKLSSDQTFVYLIPDELIKVRVPRPDAEPRPTDEICPEEIRAAIKYCLKEAGGSASETDVVRLVVNLYGYQRMATKVTEPVQTVLDTMLREKSLVSVDGVIRVADKPE